MNVTENQKKTGIRFGDIKVEVTTPYQKKETMNER